MAPPLKHIYNIFKCSQKHNDSYLLLIKTHNKNRPKPDATAFCQAPFKSMYFAQNGNVRACCYNRSFIFGNIGLDNIESIWNGKNIKALRKALTINDLHLGCYVCQQNLVNQNYMAIGALNYDKLIKPSGTPAMLEFECDNTCNLECVMCTEEYSSAIQNKTTKPLQHSNAYGKDFIQQLKPYLTHITDAKFNGGEPFLSKLYHDIFEEIIRLNPACNISVQTNATVLNQKVKDVLSKARFHISVSVDALNKELYEAIRINAHFETSMQNIAFFRDYCHEKATYFGLAVCPMRINWKEMPGLLSYANQNRAHIHFHNVWFPPKLSLWNLSSTELEHIYLYLSRFKWSANTELEKENITKYRTLIAQIEQWRSMALEYEKKEYHKRSAAELRHIIIENIDLWCENNIADIQKQAQKKENYKSIINEITDVFRNKQLSTCYKEILKTPVDFIITTFETEEKEKIAQRFKSYIF